MIKSTWILLVCGLITFNSCGVNDSSLKETTDGQASTCKTAKPIFIGASDPRGPQKYDNLTKEISLKNVSFYQAPKSGALKNTKDGRWSTWANASFIKNGEFQIDLYRIYIHSYSSDVLIPSSRLGTRLSNGNTFGESISGNATNTVQGIETSIVQEDDITTYTTLNPEPSGVNKVTVKVQGEYLISYEFTYIESKPVKSKSKDLISVWTVDHKKKPTTVCLKSAELLKK